MTVAAVATLVALLLTGCSSTENPLFDSAPAGGYADPGVLVAEHERALEARDFERYERTLAEDFRFFVRPDIVDQLAWLDGDGSWSLDEELGMIAHLMDPAWVGGSLPVRAIDVRFVRLLARTLKDGTYEWTYGLTGTVLVGDFTGWSVDTRLVLRIAAAEDGWLRIREIREVIPDAGGRAGGLTWGAIKARYR